MNINHCFFVTVGVSLLSSFASFSQEKRKVDGDPGVSVHNYKQPHKARKADKLREIERRGYFQLGVGIGRRPIIAPDASYQNGKPRYKQQPFWLFPRKEKSNKTQFNPLKNPGNYKTQD